MRFFSGYRSCSKVNVHLVSCDGTCFAAREGKRAGRVRLGGVYSRRDRCELRRSTVGKWRHHSGTLLAFQRKPHEARWYAPGAARRGGVHPNPRDREVKNACERGRAKDVSRTGVAGGAIVVMVRKGFVGNARAARRSQAQLRLHGVDKRRIHGSTSGRFGGAALSGAIGACGSYVCATGPAR